MNVKDTFSIGKTMTFNLCFVPTDLETGLGLSCCCQNHSMYVLLTQ